jgi:hypothetical protein
MRKIIVGLFVVCMLPACVSTKTVKADVSTLQQAGHQTVIVSKRELPSFSAMTAGKAGFGLIGAAAMISAGNTIVRENQIEDPAVAIADGLGRALAEQLSVPVRVADDLLDSTNPAAIAKQYPGAGLLLDVQTVNWSFGYFPTDWNNYRVIYSVKVRLIDTRTGKLVAEGFCARVPEYSADAPSHDELLGNNAAELKARLKRSGEQCQEELKSQTLGLT